MNRVLITYDTQCEGKFFNPLRGEWEKDRLTVVILCKPEGIPRPYSDELIPIVTKSMRHHILHAVRLRRAPNHNVEPRARLRRKEIRAKGGEIGAGHDAARGRKLVL